MIIFVFQPLIKSKDLDPVGKLITDPPDCTDTPFMHEPKIHIFRLNRKIANFIHNLLNSDSKAITCINSYTVKACLILVL